MARRFPCSSLLCTTPLLLLLCTASIVEPATRASAAAPSSHGEEITAGLEEIMVFRTTRTARTRGATAFCRSAGFDPLAEDQYTLWSLKLESPGSRGMAAG